MILYENRNLCAIMSWLYVTEISETNDRVVGSMEKLSEDEVKK